MGDVTFLHDVGGLLMGPGQRRPSNLTIVVSNDNGGGIFETLEVGAPEVRGSFEEAFGTSHDVDLEAIAQAYDVSYVRADSLAQLIDALTDDALAPITLIEARTTRTTRRALAERLRA